jgi:microcystin-dependent protein
MNTKKIAELTTLDTPSSTDLLVVEHSPNSDPVTSKSEIGSLKTPLGIGATDSPTFAGVTLSGLTASLPVFTDASKALVSKSVADLATLVGNILFPIGSIYTSVVSTNPATLLGFGTWTAFGTGRVPVGFDSNQTEFNTVEKTGGAKTHTLTTAELASHSHTFTTGTESADHTHTGSGNTGDRSAVHQHTATAQFWQDGGPTSNIQTGTGANITVATPTTGNESAGHTHPFSFTTSGRSSTHTHSGTVDSSGSGAAHNNLQPYIVVYMWKRTA